MVQSEDKEELHVRPSSWEKVSKKYDLEIKLGKTAKLKLF
jgi:hypothetical protein